jgi:hypothetical protein
VLLLIPIMVVILRSIHWHYTQVAKQLSLADVPPLTALRRHTAVVLISGAHRGVIPALQYGLSLAPDNVTASPRRIWHSSSAWILPSTLILPHS